MTISTLSTIGKASGILAQKGHQNNLRVSNLEKFSGGPSCGFCKRRELYDFKNAILGIRPATWLLLFICVRLPVILSTQHVYQVLTKMCAAHLLSMPAL